MRIPAAPRAIAALVAADAAHLRRDRGTLVFLLLAVACAVGLHGLLREAERDLKAIRAAAAAARVEIALSGESPPGLDAWLRDRGLVPVRPAAGPEAAVRDGTAVGLAFDTDEAGRPRAIILQAPQRLETGPARQRLAAALRDYAADAADRRLAAHGLSRADLDPLPTRVVDVADAPSPPSLVARLRPAAPRAAPEPADRLGDGVTGLIAAVLGVLAGMSACMDCWLGPRMRGALDPLAALPVRLSHLLLAKGAAAALLGAALSLPAAAGFAWGALRVDAPATVLAAALSAAVVANAALACAVACATSARIRDGKWAQVLGTASSSALLAVAGLLPDLPPDAPWAPWLPFLGPLRAVEDAAAGAVGWPALATSTALTLALAALLLRLAAALTPRDLLLAAD